MQANVAFNWTSFASVGSNLNNLQARRDNESCLFTEIGLHFCIRQSEKHETRKEKKEKKKNNSNNKAEKQRLEMDKGWTNVWISTRRSNELESDKTSTSNGHDRQRIENGGRRRVRTKRQVSRFLCANANEPHRLAIDSKSVHEHPRLSSVRSNWVRKTSTW